MTDINAADLNKEGNLLATGDDYGFVKLFDFPSKVGLFIVIFQSSKLTSLLEIVPCSYLQPHLYYHGKECAILIIQLVKSFHALLSFCTS